MVSLPLDKLARLSTLLQEFSHKKKITLRQLQSVVGILNFACRAVVPGRPFTRRLINLSIGLSQHHHHIRINSEARADAQAWLFFLKNFNGTSLFLHETWKTSDALNLGTEILMHQVNIMQSCIIQNCL